MSVESGQVLSHYRLLEKIGQGAMGVVYRALDTHLQRHVAIKVLRPQKFPDEGDRRRFQNEARTAASLNHPNICTIHEVGEAEDRDSSDARLAEILPGTPFIVMELLEGEPLSARLQRDGALPLPDLLDTALQLAEGLQEAHAHGVTHRDLKPHNIVTTATGRAKILDFGLAQPRSKPVRRNDDPEEAETLTLETDPSSRIAGTIAYMSPEQTLGKELNQRSDVFSFGIILYEMAAGTRPFPGDSITEAVAKILEANPVPLPRLRPEIPSALVAVVERCLRKQAEERYQDAGELLQSLRSLRHSDTGPGAAASVCPNTVTVLPFAFRGAESFAYLREGMVNLLSTKLDGAGELRSVDTNVILCCNTLTGWEPEPAGGREVALRHNAGLFVLGSVVEIGAQLHVETALYDSQGEDDPLARAAAEGPAAEIFEMVDRLTAELLAERCGGPNARLTRIAATSTDSFPALKAYLEGEQEMREMRRAPAVDAFRRAVQHDPRFALARYRLGVAALWSQQPEDAWEAIRRAREHRDRLTQRDGRLLGAFDALLRGDAEQAEHLYRNIVGNHPDDVEAWYQLSELLFHDAPLRGRPLRESRQAWERLLALDPRHLPALVHLGVIAGNENDVDALEAHTRRVLELGPKSDSALWLRALRGFVLQDAELQEQALEELRRASDHAVTWSVRLVGVYLGDLSAAVTLSRLLTETVRSPEARALGHFFLGYLEVTRGRWHRGLAEIDAARKLHPAYALEYDALLRLAPFGPQASQDLENLAAQLSDWSPPADDGQADPGLWLTPHQGLHPPLRDYLLGLVFARLGRGEEAGKQAARLERCFGKQSTGTLVADLAASVRAHAARAGGDVAQALEILGAMKMETSFYLTLWSPFLARTLERYHRAEWLQADGQMEQALRWYASFSENSIFDLIFLAPSHFRRGEIHQQLGELERAAEHYARFLELWSGCDVELEPRVEEAGKRLLQVRAGDSNA